MDIFNTPALFLGMLEFKHGTVIDELYAAMRSGNLSDVVMIALKILKKVGHMPPISREEKSEDKSNSYRKEGNSAYVSGKYEEAYILYNKALMFAPDSSTSMKLAYSNRSALLFKIPNYSACKKDIDMCLAMGCPSDITEKLLKRRADLSAHLWIEKMEEASQHSQFCDEYFKLNKKLNPDNPCASRDVRVVAANESSEEKVVATKDINVGTVLAIETAFSSLMSASRMSYSCYYCHKAPLNLIPCDGCCVVMFCNKDCKELCMNEGHDIECQFIIDINGDLNCEQSRIILALKAALKIKRKCKSWNEFISMSYGFDCEGIDHNLTNVNEKFPILTNRSVVDLPYGSMFNTSFHCAVIINTLDSVQSFFPKLWSEKQDAIRAFSRVMLYLTVYANRTLMTSCGSGVLKYKDTVKLMEPDLGYFSLIGKLRHSCNANTFAVGLNNKIALVALQPIKCGTDITISYIGLYDVNDNKNVNKLLVTFNKTVCDCIVSKGDYELSPAQMKSLQKLNILEMAYNFDVKRITDMFPKVCETLACLSSLPHSNEYRAVYDLFCKFIMAMQDLHLGNNFIDFH